MHRIASLVLFAPLLSACMAVYTVPKGKPTAEISLTTLNDSSGTTLRTAYMWAFANEECERSQLGIRAGLSMNNAETATTEPHTILAGEKFVFTAAYGDARYAANRECSVTAGFTPLPGHRYQALLAIGGNVSACKLGIYDVTSEKKQQIDFSMPSHVCGDAGKRNLANGQPLWTDWKIEVTVSSF